MSDFCDKITNKFLEWMEKGYGHADEQLMYGVWVDDPETFDWYLGDHHSMITNYCHVYDECDAPVYNFIRNTLACGELELCEKACKMMFVGIEKGVTKLSPEYQKMLDYCYVSIEKTKPKKGITYTDEGKDCDVIYLGTMAPRIQAVQDELYRRGLRSWFTPRVSDDFAKDAIRRSRVCIVPSEKGIDKEQVDFLLANGACVVAESSGTELYREEKAYEKHGITVVNYDGITRACMFLVSMYPLRKEKAEQGCAWYANGKS